MLVAGFDLTSWPLPRLDFTGNDGEKRVGRDLPKSAKCSIPAGLTKAQLAFQVSQLKIQLPLGDGQRPGPSFSGDLGRIEGVPSLGCFVMNRPEVGRDRRHRRWTLEKSSQLRVGAIPFRLPLQDLLGKQGFSPKSDQALLVQEGWMERPQPHLEYPVLSSVLRGDPQRAGSGKGGRSCPWRHA
jgi:hypothetical protein